jgi:hypothetical protein
MVPMTARGMVLEMRWGAPAWRRGAAGMPGKRPSVLRGWMPKLVRCAGRTMSMMRMSHMRAMRAPQRMRARRRGCMRAGAVGLVIVVLGEVQSGVVVLKGSRWGGVCVGSLGSGVRSCGGGRGW